MLLMRRLKSIRTSYAVVDFEVQTFSGLFPAGLKILANAARGWVIIFEIVGRRERTELLPRLECSGDGPLAVTGEVGLAGCSEPVSMSSCMGRSER
jgi:hypothetical protein